jgi:hypothetical protein
MRAGLIVTTIIAGGLALAIGGAVALAGKPGAAAGLYPDFASAVPHHFTVQKSGQVETLRFSNGIANIGAGPFRSAPRAIP